MMTETAIPMAALSLTLRPAEAGFESEDCVTAKLAVLDGDREDVSELARKVVETATLTTAVAPAFAMCTANEPFSPQIPQSGTLRALTNQVATAAWYWAGSAVAVAGLANE